jgi:hypothetical protein
VPVPIGSYCSFTDTFKVDAAAVGSCRFNLTGGTSDGSLWSGNCNFSIVLTRLYIKIYTRYRNRTRRDGV